MGQPDGCDISRADPSACPATGSRRDPRLAVLCSALALACIGLTFAVGIGGGIANWLAGEPVDPRVLRFLTWMFGGAGAALGAIGLVRTGVRAAGPRRRLAVVALALSGYNLVLLFAASHQHMLPQWSSMSYSKRQGCLQEVEHLAEAVSMYLADNDGTFPPARTWARSLEPCLRARSLEPWLPSHLRLGSLRCANAPNVSPPYAFNSGVAGKHRGDLQAPQAVVVFFESDAGGNAVGGPELLPKKPRHMGGDNYGFADGAARWVPRSKAKELQWEPVLKEPAEGGNQKKPEPDGESQE